MYENAPLGDDGRDPVEKLAEEFLLQRRQGHAVTAEDFIGQYPGLADRIRSLFPVLELIEDLKPESNAMPEIPAAVSPEQVGDFHIVREIGRGGMGVVFEAVQESLQRRVALKLLSAAALASPARLARFQREAQAAARLHHTHIVPIFGLGAAAGVHYIVMQYIPGQGLDRVLAALRNEPVETEGPTHEVFSAAAAAALVRNGLVREIATPVASAAAGFGSAYWHSVARMGVQAAEALDYAHRQGTFHRDIKPANLLLDSAGTVWIADFGLAKLADADDLTRSGDAVGTVRYMAPEQHEGRCDARSDVYSLGLTLYELCTLRPAFENHLGRLLRGKVSEPIAPRQINAQIPRDIETILVKATAADPDHRYQSAGELAADLQCYLDDRPIVARRVRPLARLWRWARRNRAIAALSGLVLGLLVAVAMVASVGYLRTNQALARVSTEREEADRAWRQAEAERLRSNAEHDRAEANLRLAMQVFERLTAHVAPDALPKTTGADDEESWSSEAVAVNSKDAALLETLLGFYEQFAGQNQTNAGLRLETARAYRRMGDIQRRLGQYAKSETAYQRALQLYSQPGFAPEGEAAIATAAVHNELGLLCRGAERFYEARSWHGKAKESLTDLPPAVAALPEARLELARTYELLSSAPLGPAAGGPRRGRRGSGWTGWSERAAGENAQARELLESLLKDAPREPRVRFALARVERDRASLAARRGEFNMAQAARGKAIALLEELMAQSPQHLEFRFELAESLAMSWHLPLGGSTNAERRRAVEIGQDLVARCPEAPEYRAALARWRLAYSESLWLGQLGEAAFQELLRAAELQRGLVKDLPEVTQHRFALVRSLDRLTEQYKARGDRSRARACAEEALGHLQALQQADSSPPFFRMAIGLQQTRFAQLLRELGEPSPR